MPSWRRTSWRTGLWAATVLTVGTAWGAAEGNQAVLRVMSFNVRFATAPDGENHWTRRRELLVETIRAYRPDLLGTQEVLAEQADFLSQRLAGHTLVGVGRDDGRRAGEFSAIWYDASRFERVGAGNFWLSESPQTPGSKSWDAAITRLASWVRLRDRQQAGRELLVLNTHWDHVGAKSRLESARLVRRWLAEQAGAAAVVVTGDLNTGDASEPYRELTAAAGSWPALRDAYRALHPAAKDEATFHGFTGRREGARIDFVFCSPHFAPVAAAIDRSSRDGRYPSDHFPVTADLRWQADSK